MNFVFFKELFSSQSINALCWTLFHSLWQGLIFSFIAGLVIMLTRRSKPVFRYNILSSLFVFLALTIIATFFYEQQKAGMVPIQQASVYLLPAITADYSQTWVAVNPGEKNSPSQLLNGFFSQYAYLIVAVWFFILSAKSVKMIFTLLYTRHLRKYRSHVPSPVWRKEMALLCQRLKISRAVILLESEIIKLPVVFGHFKPVIFIPLGLLSNLTPELVEAILIHELAHIRRNDYLVNLAQNIFETLFFFNPGILWISSLIREERENCCDDVAIAQTRNKKRYVEALISFKELSLYNGSKCAVAFPGNKNGFINRVRRILQNKNYTLSPIEKGSLLGCCTVATVLVLAFAHPIQSNSLNKFTSPGKVSKSEAPILQATALKPARNNPLSVEKIQKHHSSILLRGLEKSSVKQSGDLKWTPDTIPVPTKPVLPAPPFSYASALEGMRQVIADLVSAKVVADAASVVSFGLTDTELVVNDQRQTEALHQRLKIKYGIHQNYGWYYGPVKMTGKGLFIDVAARKPSLPPPPPRARLFKLTPQVKMRENLESKRFASFSQMIDNIDDDLVSENLVKDRSSLISFHLSNQLLMVNGKRQPEDIQEKLRKKYLVDPQVWIDPLLRGDPNFGIHYNRETGSMGIGIHQDQTEQVNRGPKTDTCSYIPSRGVKYMFEHRGYSSSGKADASGTKYGTRKLLETMENSEAVMDLNGIIHQLALQNKTSDEQVPDGDIEAAIRAKKMTMMLERRNSADSAAKKQNLKNLNRFVFEPGKENGKVPYIGSLY